MNKIQKVGAVFRAFWFVSFILVLTGFISLLLYSLIGQDEFHFVGLTVPAGTQVGERLLILLPMTCIVVFGSMVLFSAYRLFDFFSKGEIFTDNIVKYLEKIVWAYLAGISLYLLSLGFIYYFINETYVKAQIKFQLGISDFLIPLMVIFVSWIIKEGATKTKGRDL